MMIFFPLIIYAALWFALVRFLFWMVKKIK
jgi:hypothetical protein